jgi:acetylornithine deacetylase/succinyl-diaminopimelate desuccinylase-like protein
LGSRSGLLLFIALCASNVQSQTVVELANDAAVKQAFESIKRNEPNLLLEQQRICEIPAPPFQESARAAELQKLFEQLGLSSVHIDKAGNVIAVHPGAKPRPNLVVAAHLDTVFPAGTDVKVKREGDVFSGPGIADDCRGLAVLLGVIRALNTSHITTPGTITFVADVGEEGLGDLRGMKELFGASLKGSIDAFISIDGLGSSITNTGVGSYRYKVTFKGPGGHSYGSFGMANPIQAMGRAIAKIDQFQVPETPKTTFNVGRVGGGTSVNAIPFEAWMEVDLRSVDMSMLAALNEKFKTSVSDAATEENQRWNGRGAVTVTTEVVGLRPAGQTPESARIVTTALEVNRVLDLSSHLSEGSTDANIPMNLSIPALTIGGGGGGSGAHSLNETFNAQGSWKGTQRALLLAVALAR